MARTLMTGVVSREWAALAVANTDVSNAFGHDDDLEDIEWSSRTWAQAASAAQRLADRADVLAQAARDIAHEREQRLEPI